ncbi:MAG: glycosyltransferase family 9 protein [Desulfobacterota bacterium]|nr:glycosyltransferase family 9 protein [Thermodesulfobacteriota bacterium]
MKENAKHTLVIAVAGIGDLILASKAIRALKNRTPETRLNILTSTEAAILARNYPYVDHVWSLPIREFRREKSQFFVILRTLLQLRKISFDVVVNLYRVVSRQGALRMGLLFRLLKSAEKIGHDSKGFGLFLDAKAPKETFENRHFTDAMLDLAKLAGGAPDDRGIEVFWDESVEAKCAALFPKVGQEKQPLRVGINPGADRPEKRWNPENHAVVADRLSELRGTEIFVFGGPGEEHLASRIEKAMKHPSTNLAGKLSLNDLAYVISQLDLFVTNDSGPMHIAAAVKTPVVALFGPEDPVYTRPYTTPDLYRIVQKELSCRPCMNKRCDQPVCMESIKPEEVLQACLELLDRPV